MGSGRLSFRSAAQLTGFWLFAGVVFGFFVLLYFGFAPFLGFVQGFVLEYMLSFDNLFVFHLVFSYYCTPDQLLYRALYFGIGGAVVFRVLLFAIGFGFLNSG